MKIKFFVLAGFLVGLIGMATQPSSAARVELLSGYLKDPHEVSVPGGALSGTEFAIVEIVSVRPDKKPRGGWGETGWLGLIRIESNGKSLPIVFSVPYQKRGGVITSPSVITMVNCETWDNIAPRPGKRLLGFFQPDGVRPDGKGWVIPELPSSSEFSHCFGRDSSGGSLTSEHFVFGADEKAAAVQVQKLFLVRAN